MKLFSPTVEVRAKERNTLADLIVEQLEKLGVEYIFGVPGGSIEPLYNAMARSQRAGGLRPVVARHEAGAAFMADGYARETGKLGVCCSTTGPGATNLLTGVASAHIEQVPVLAITAQTVLHSFGRQTLQESTCSAVDTVAIFKACTRYSSLVSHRGQLENKLAAAIAATQGAPAGPAHLSIPMDIMADSRRMNSYQPMASLDFLLKKPAVTDAAAVAELVLEIQQAKRMVLLLGDGCGSAIDEIIRFAERLQVPIITGPSGKRWISQRHPLYHGVLGFAGHKSASDRLKDERNDLVLAVGTRFSEMMYPNLEKDKWLNSKLVHIDDVLENFCHSPMARLHVCGALPLIFSTLLNSLPDRERKQPVAVNHTAPTGEGDKTIIYTAPRVRLDDEDSCYSSAVPLKPQRVMRELSLRLPEDARVFVDAGNSWAWATHYLHLQKGGLYRIAIGFGSMTWAIGAAIGSAVASKGVPTICLTGDGSYLMSGQEITVAVEEKLPVVFIVLNDRALGMVKHGQRLGGAESIAHELPPVDFVGLAHSLGAQAEVVRTPEELESLDLISICERPGPTLIEVQIDGEEVPPIGARMKTLERG
ncbi:acetolactate synthase-1/2/3 large subunit [Malonomonas rubra DSM 5091]|uniref:Acetolactate synthase-1/2/3 large subunit n=2 Tax=Malonomonas rubra TaxID=57040 RepID=A0A1M6BHQ0_MALRU|nr:acetolactate synthase-1/2/3 large subunit [Malonomonas rubra DSM 5091]